MVSSAQRRTRKRSANFDEPRSHSSPPIPPAAPPQTPTSFLVVIYDPSRLKPARRGDFAIYYKEGERVVFAPSFGQSPVEQRTEEDIRSVRLMRGLNTVEAEVWKKCLEFESQAEGIRRYERFDAIIALEPDSEIFANDSTDFDDLESVMLLVENCQVKDIPWLERSVSREQRGEVAGILGEALENLKKRRTQSSLGGSVGGQGQLSGIY